MIFREIVYAGSMKRSEWYRRTLTAIGPVNLAKLQLGMKTGGPFLDHPVEIRPGTSDKAVFDQIFVDREYRCLDNLLNVSTILDCGANVGYSAGYLLSRYKTAQLLAIEPDRANFDLLQRNMLPYGGRVSCLHGAVWDRETTLQFDEATVGAGAEWGRQMKEGTGDVTAFDIPALMSIAGFQRIGLLKIDVEGAEREIFACDADKWLPLVDNIVIELHGDSATRIFHKAIEPYGFIVSRCDELTVCLKAISN